MKSLLTAVLGLWGSIAVAQDVVIIGEIHDNPHHHQVQAERVAELQPAAIVFEMLTREQAGLITGQPLLPQEDLASLLNWADSGWPDFSMYYPIFTASVAQVFGAAVPRELARQSMSDGLAAAFGKEAGRYGLTEPLPAAQQVKREALQAAAHCDALPDIMLAPMVDIQRLRDAALARAVIEAMQATGGPVVVITGNGHARRDWGVPAVLARAAPELEVLVIGQGEAGGAPEGGFDIVVDAPLVDRPDPCLAFQ